MKKYTDEEVEYLISIVEGRSYKEIIELFNSKFDEKINTQQLKSFIKRKKINTGRNGRFEKGHVPVNKGKKITTRGSITQFKNGHVPHNYKPIGSEIINSQGYIKVKIKDPSKWEFKHILIWKQRNGEIPNGHVIIFGDRNKLNTNIENLILVSKAQLGMLNRHKLIQSDTDLTKIGIAISNLYLKINEKKGRK